ncbi:hypothetical protein PoB_000563200 [Plakobranchus ocellatus]|uniref:Uncharacterized protein n=1 Tax=Plakobranchus ocellatus TaxID=259542 RepID=A0AAV3Y8L2_9GAST|nr:hypothetical protein PoB_000563200 [Plakobranchus ocellatus]
MWPHAHFWGALDEGDPGSRCKLSYKRSLTYGNGSTTPCRLPVRSCRRPRRGGNSNKEVLRGIEPTALNTLLMLLRSFEVLSVVGEGD